MSYFTTDDSPPRRGRIRAPIGKDACMCEFFGSVFTAGDHPHSITIVQNSTMVRWTFFETFWDMQAWVLKCHEKPTRLSDVMPGILARANEVNEA